MNGRATISGPALVALWLISGTSLILDVGVRVVLLAWYVLATVMFARAVNEAQRRRKDPFR